jgi:acyl carrier protein
LVDSICLAKKCRVFPPIWSVTIPSTKLVTQLESLIRGEQKLETLKSELRQMLTDLASLPPGFDENADLYRDLGMTSMKAMELLMSLEERYEVSVPDEEFIEATSLERLATMMQALKS